MNDTPLPQAPAPHADDFALAAEVLKGVISEQTPLPVKSLTLHTNYDQGGWQGTQEGIVLNVKVPNLESLGERAIAQAVAKGLGVIPELHAILDFPKQEKSGEALKAELQQVMTQQGLTAEQQKPFLEWQGFKDHGPNNWFSTVKDSPSGFESSVAFNIPPKQGDDQVSREASYANIVEANVKGRLDAITEKARAEFTTEAIRINNAAVAEGKAAIFSADDLANLQKMQLVASAGSHPQGGGRLEVVAGLPKEGVTIADSKAFLQDHSLLTKFDEDLTHRILADAVLHTDGKAAEGKEPVRAAEVYDALVDRSSFVNDLKKAFAGKDTTGLDVILSDARLEPLKSGLQTLEEAEKKAAITFHKDGVKHTDTLQVTIALPTNTEAAPLIARIANLHPARQQAASAPAVPPTTMVTGMQHQQPLAANENRAGIAAA